MSADDEKRCESCVPLVNEIKCIHDPSGEYMCYG